MELLHVVTNQPVLRLAGLIALACSVCGACAQPDATSAVRAYLDPDTPESERVALDTQLKATERSEIVAALVEVVENETGAVRSEAIAWLASEPGQTPESLSVLSAAAIGGDDRVQHTILGSLRMHLSEAEMRIIARDLIDHFIAMGTVPPVGTSRASSIDLAATALAGSSDPADLARLLGVVALRQSDRGVWLALSSFGPLPQSEQTAAEDLYGEAGQPLLLQVAAAIAASASDPAARTFAVNEIQQAITVVSNAGDWTILVADAYGGDQTAKAILRETRETHAPLITMAPFLGGDEAETLLKSAFSVPNQLFADSAGYAAARRVPDAVIDEAPAHFPDDRLTGLLAIVLVHHPEREAEVTPLAPDAAALNAARAAYAESGISALFPLAPASFDGL